MNKKLDNMKKTPYAAADFHCNDAHSQRIRLLQRLREANVSTTDARSELDIMDPAARVQELREMGNMILTVRIADLSASHRKRNIARYVLVQEASHE